MYDTYMGGEGKGQVFEMQQNGETWTAKRTPQSKSSERRPDPQAPKEQPASENTADIKKQLKLEGIRSYGRNLAHLAYSDDGAALRRQAHDLLLEIIKETQLAKRGRFHRLAVFVGSRAAVSEGTERLERVDALLNGKAELSESETKALEGRRKKDESVPTPENFQTQITDSHRAMESLRNRGLPLEMRTDYWNTDELANDGISEKEAKLTFDHGWNLQEDEELHIKPNSDGFIDRVKP